MFNRILVRRTTHSDVQKPVDLGLLCEAMLFYREVVVLADHVIMKQLVSDLGPDTLGALLENDFLRISYVPLAPAILTSDERGDPVFAVRHVGLADGTETYINRLVLEKVGKKTRAERKSARILRHLKTTQESDLVERSFHEYVADQNRIKPAVALIIQHLLQTNESVSPFRFEGYFDGKRLRIATDLDFSKLNETFHRFVAPAEATLTAPLLLSHIVNAQSDTCLASTFGAEIATDPLYQKLARLDLSDAVAARAKSAANVGLFKDYIFDEGKDIKTAINSGARSIDDFLKILEAAKNFKRWTASINDDASFMKEYYRAVTKPSWVDKLPGKMSRWALFNMVGLGIDALGAGGIGTAGSLSLSALDQFYLDQLVKGWRPNQFIDQVKSFTTTKAA